MEIWDMYDENRRCTGRTGVRGEPIAQDDYHLVVHMIFMNSKGELLIQKRAHEKALHPDIWAFTGGSALQGETSAQACIRETREELGFEPDMTNAKVIFSATTAHNHVIRDVYFIEQDVDAAALTLQKEEVQAARWVLPEDLLSDSEIRSGLEQEMYFERVIGDLSRWSGEKRVRKGRYRHFKGKEYIVLGVAVHSETLCPLVVYQAQYGSRGVWVRPLSMWNERVVRQQVDAPRFTYIGEA